MAIKTDNFTSTFLKHLTDSKYCKSLLGGGGKSSFLIKAASSLRQNNFPVLLSLTTKVSRQQFQDYNIIQANNLDDALKAAKMAMDGSKIFLAGSSYIANKYCAPPINFFEIIKQEFPQLNIIIESDGSKSFPLKAYNRDYEPAIAPISQKLIYIVGASALFLNVKQAVHRANLVEENLGLKLNDSLNAKKIWLILKQYALPLNPDIFFINQVESLELFEQSKKLATLINNDQPKVKIIIGSLKQNKFFLFN